MSLEISFHLQMRLWEYALIFFIRGVIKNINDLKETTWKNILDPKQEKMILSFSQ